MMVDLWMLYMVILILMTLTLMKGHSGLAKAKNQGCMLLATKQAISIKLATTVGHFLCDLDLDFICLVHLGFFNPDSLQRWSSRMRKWLLLPMNLRMRKAYIVHRSASAYLCGHNQYFVACRTTANV